MTQPVGPIPVQPPVPSILTTARDRSADGFGASAPIPGGVADALPEGVETTTAAWRSGIVWQSFACQQSYLWAHCPPGDDTLKERSDYSGPEASSVFTIYTPLDCDWAAIETGLDAAARALTEAHSAFGLARALWMGEGLPDALTPNGTYQPTLRRSATDLGDAADDLDVVVARLLGEYETATGGLGGAVLHVPSILMTGALGGLPGGGKIATPEGNVYRGPLGSLVSPGPGYPWGASTEGADGYGPVVADGDTDDPDYAGSAADEVWVYVTGPVEYALGPVVIERSSGSTLRTNTVEVIAERPAIYRFDPCSSFAALATNPYVSAVS